MTGRKQAHVKQRNKENKSIHHLKEPKVSFHFQSISIDLQKRSIQFFLAELLYKTIREEVPDLPLFQWIYNALTWFDLSEKSILNYHLVFMIQLSRFLGFYPKYNPSENPVFFDLQEGRFCINQPQNPQYISGYIITQLISLSGSTFENSDNIKISTGERRKILDSLVTYYQLHLPGFGEMKSIEVLKTII